MPVISVPIRPQGALIQIAIGVSAPRRNALQAAGLDIPPHMNAIGLIDTGASCTCIDPVVVANLGLTPTGTTLQFTPSTGQTPAMADLYDVSFTWVHHAPLSRPIMSVIQSELFAVQGFHVLIGRDALAPCLVVYDGRSSRCNLAF